MKTKTSPQEILAFLDAAKRLPDNPKKELWVKFLVRQFELTCEATVIRGKPNENTDNNL
jgi:hypothetical protein